ncbi:MAG: ribosomal protein S18-alanine N-acetyltransferase [Bacillota bacterium]
MSLIIDLMDEKDIKEVLRIERNVFTNPWSKNAFINELRENPHAIYFIAKKDNKIVAYIGFWILVDYIHITNLAVKKEYRKQGIATILFEKMENIALSSNKRKFYLEVRESNKKAINFYKKRDFKIIDRKINYYTNNDEDALIMGKVINNE